MPYPLAVDSLTTARNLEETLPNLLTGCTYTRYGSLMTKTEAPQFTNTTTPEACWAGYVTLATGITRPAMSQDGVVYYDKAPTAKAHWSGFHKAPAKLAASYVETNPTADKW